MSRPVRQAREGNVGLWRQPRKHVCRTDARKTAPKPSLMKLFKLLSQG